MKIKLQLSLFILLSIQISYAQYIKVDTTYTAKQLVEDVFVKDASGLEISNIKMLTGVDFGSTQGIGYFSEKTNNFYMQEGVLLTSGRAKRCEGPEDTPKGGINAMGEGSKEWIGDADLEAIVPHLKKTLNASYISFDFKTPSDINELNFDFVFASEEYGFYQCKFGDAFAFILTDKETNQKRNLAVVPNTSQYISVTSVRDSIYDTRCASSNSEYFGRFFGEEVVLIKDDPIVNAGEPADKDPTNFIGFTKKMKASATVKSNTTYNIKLVVADDAIDKLNMINDDTEFDVGVFLEAKSFAFTQNLGNNTFKQVSNYRAYPNPVNNTLKVVSNKNYGVVTARLLDINGRVIFSKEINLTEDEKHLDVSGLNYGVYILNLKGDAINSFDKIVKE